MDVSSTSLIILIVAIVILALVYVYLSSNSKKRQRELKASELKPQSTLVEPKKEIEQVNPLPEPVLSAVIETSEEVEPVDVAPVAVAQSSTIETQEEASTLKEVEITPIESPRKRKKPITKTKDRGANIKDIEGIGPFYSEKLNSIGVHTTSDLLESGATPSGRRELAERTGISHDLILKWVNLSDLFRIKGIGEEYSELLEGAGVDTVVELSHRNAVNLHAKILEVNDTKKLVRRPPSQVMVEGWIMDSKNLPRKIEY